MTRGRRFSAALLGAVAALLIGRGAAVLYATSAWYDALGAGALLRERLRDGVLLYGGAFLVGAVLAGMSFVAMRGSVTSVVVQRSVGGMEFVEEVSRTRMWLLIAFLSVGVSAVSLFVLPSWTEVALWRAGVTFGEMDPYFQLDLAFYVTWFPLELAAYAWTFLLLTITSVATVALYALTPSLRWGRSGLRLTAYARRHLTLLAVVLVLFTAWGYRLDAYQALLTGSGVGGAFTRLDHEWRIPLEIGLSILTVGAALVLLAAGWMGQTRTALAAVSLLLLAAILVKVALPWGARALNYASAGSAGDAPYAATRTLFTTRAFVPDPDRAAREESAARQSKRNASGPATLPRDGRATAVFPGARGFALVDDSTGAIPAPHLGTGAVRLMNAWALQNPHLLDGDIPATSALITRRDVRERVAALAPVFRQGETVRSMSGPGSDWVVELFATTRYFPLSAPRLVAGKVATYDRHVATAFVQPSTGRVAIVPDASLDPIASAWFGAYGGSYLAASAPQANLPVVTGAGGAPLAPSDSAFRESVKRAYQQMRDALAAGNLKAFAEAFDSLGAVIAP